MSIVDAQLDLASDSKWRGGYIHQPSLLPLPPPYETSPKTRVTKSYVSSVQHNVRNLESPTHSLYGNIFHELTQPYDNLIPQVQYTLSMQKRAKGSFATPGRGHVQSPNVNEQGNYNEDVLMSDTDDELMADGEQAAEENAAPAEQESIDIGNTSNHSARTVEGVTKELMPDIAILHARLSIMTPPHPGATPNERIRYARRAGLKLNHLCPAMIGEFKRTPSRQIYPTDPDSWTEALNSKRYCMTAAINDLYAYLACAFAVHPYMTSIIAFAASGIYWTYGVFGPGDVPKVDPKTGAVIDDRNDAEMAQAAFNFSAEFSLYQEVGTNESDEVFTQLRNMYLHPLACDNFDAATELAHAKRSVDEKKKWREALKEASPDPLALP